MSDSSGSGVLFEDTIDRHTGDAELTCDRGWPMAALDQLQDVRGVREIDGGRKCAAEPEAAGTLGVSAQ